MGRRGIPAQLRIGVRAMLWLLLHLPATALAFWKGNRVRLAVERQARALEAARVLRHPERYRATTTGPGNSASAIPGRGPGSRPGPAKSR